MDCLQQGYYQKNTYLFYRKKEEEHEMDKKKMKDEAARRMKALELYDFPARSIIRAFMNDDAVFVSLPAKGNRVAELHPLTDAEKKMVKNFEEEYGAVAYHVIRNEFETGITYSTIYSILYVSDKEKEWKTECNGFKDFSSAYIASPMVYTWDAGRAERDTDDLSAGTGSFCAITVTIGCGGLCRQG